MHRIILAAGVVTGVLTWVDPAAAQTGRWNDITTTAGCGVSEFRNSAAPPVAIWSGACEGGRAQGRGTLEQRSATESDGSYGASRSTGEMVDGYFNGPVEYEDYWATGGQRPSRVTRQTHRYTMGCEAGWGDDCTPRRRATTTSVSAGTVPSPNGGASNHITSSNPPGFGQASSASEVDASSHNQCVQPVYPQGGAAPYFTNSCGYGVRIAYCVLNPTPGNSSQVNDCQTRRPAVDLIGAGQRQAALISGDMVYWVACRAPALPMEMRFELGVGLSARCG